MHIFIILITLLVFGNIAYSEEIISTNEKAEIELLKILDHMRNGKNEDALMVAELLSKNYPNFKLGKIIYADLLSSYLQKKPLLGSNSKDKELNDLKSEAKARINFDSVYKKNDLLPYSIIQLSKNVNFAFLIELTKSRLYVVKNNNGVPEVIADFYVSIGKGGFNKVISGDNKTPVGIYKITSHLIDDDLPELYGNGDGDFGGHPYQDGAPSFDNRPKIQLPIMPLAHWTFNENNGTTLGDAPGNENNGTLEGFDDPESARVAGKTGLGLHFDGFDDTVKIDSKSRFNLSGPFSVAL